jgi:tRNA(Ile)-lysidine synthase
VGIPAVRGCIRRPLLCCSREEIEEYCAENDIPFIEDESNADTRFTRDYIRHRVLPMLRELNPAVERALLRMREHTEDDVSFLDQVAQDALDASCCNGGYAVNAFQEQPAVIRRRMIRMLLSSVANPSFEEIHIRAAEQAVLRGSMSVSLPNGLEFCVSQDVVCVRVPSQDTVPTTQVIETFPAEIVFGKKTLQIEKN